MITKLENWNSPCRQVAVFGALTGSTYIAKFDSQELEAVISDEVAAKAGNGALPPGVLADIAEHTLTFKGLLRQPVLQKGMNVIEQRKMQLLQCADLLQRKKKETVHWFEQKTKFRRVSSPTSKGSTSSRFLPRLNRHLRLLAKLSAGLI